MELNLNMKRLFAMSGLASAGILVAAPVLVQAEVGRIASSEILLAQVAGYPRESLSAPWNGSRRRIR